MKSSFKNQRKDYLKCKLKKFVTSMLVLKKWGLEFKTGVPQNILKSVLQKRKKILKVRNSDLSWKKERVLGKK
jgi:hypothetical protein